MAVIESKLRVTLDDQVSAEARRVAGSVREMERAAEAQARAMADARARMFDAVAIGYAAYQAFSAPTEAAMDFERQLENIRQKADLTREAITTLGTEARQLGLDTAQGATKIADAVDVLLGTGIFDDRQALDVAGPLGRVSTAYEADTTEVAQATAALVGNMKVAVTEVETAYDMMAQAGKEGMFEIKDMAKEFPSLTAGAAAIGLSGVEGLADLLGALQVARMGAGSGAEAATNTANYMNKIMSPDAIRNFGEAGVDIVAEMRAAAEAGLSPLERSLEILNELTEGGKQELLGEFFADAEVQKFLRPLLANMEEYRRIRQEALDAEGVVQADFESRLETPGGAIARFQASIENFNLTVGTSLLPKLTEFINAVTPMVDGVSRFVEANDELVGAILSMTAAVIALRVAAAGLGFAGTWLKGGHGGLLGGTGGAAGAGGRAGVAGGKTGSGPAPADDLMGIGIAAPWIAESIGTAIFDRMAGDGATAQSRENTDGAWDRTAERFMSWWDNNRFDDVLVSDDPGQRELLDQIAALRQDIATLEGANLPVPPVELGFMQAELESLEAQAAEAGIDVGQGLQAGVAGQSSAVVGEMVAIMERMRVAAAAGVTIPVRAAGPAVPQAPDRALPGFSAGGRVSGPGTGTSDSILAWLSDGEYVVSADAARQYSGLLDGINSGRVASVPGGALAGGSSGQLPPVSVSFGNIIVSGGQDPRATAEEVIRTIEGRMREALGGIYADIEFGG